MHRLVRYPFVAAGPPDRVWALNVPIGPEGKSGPSDRACKLCRDPCSHTETSSRAMRSRGPGITIALHRPNRAHMLVRKTR